MNLDHADHQSGALTTRPRCRQAQGFLNFLRCIPLPLCKPNLRLDDTNETQAPCPSDVVHTINIETDQRPRPDNFSESKTEIKTGKFRDLKFEIEIKNNQDRDRDRKILQKYVPFSIIPKIINKKNLRLHFIQTSIFSMLENALLCVVASLNNSL